MSSNIIQKLKEYFERFPGIGPRQAQRFVYWLLNEDQSFLKNLSGALLEFKKEVKQCEKCFRFFTSDQCRLCNDQNRDKSRLLIVEKDVDLEGIEKAGIYNGQYFVLGDIIPFSGPTPQNSRRLKVLVNRLEEESKKELKEIILAFNADTEGDNTCRYIEKILEPTVKKRQIKISRLGRGLSTGTELEYIDADTLKSALESRK